MNEVNPSSVFSGLQPATLSEEDRADYARYAISGEDWAITGLCAKSLNERGWFKGTFGLEGEDTVLATSLTTTLVVSYMRPFTGNRGLDGKTNERETISPVRFSFSDEEKRLHKKLGLARNQFFAHSDARRFAITVFAARIPARHIIPAVYVNRTEIDLLQVMLGRMHALLREWRQDILDRRSP